MLICGKNARGAGQNKRMKQQHDKNWRDVPLTAKAPYKPYAGKPLVRFCAGGAMKIASLPLRRRAFITLLGGAAGRGQAEDFRRARKSGGRPHQRTTGCAWRDMAA